MFEKIRSKVFQAFDGSFKPKTFLWLLLITAVLSFNIIFNLIKITPNFVGTVQQTAEKYITKSLPDGFELKITNGTLSTNQKEPFYVKIESKDLAEIEKVISNKLSDVNNNVSTRLLVIDTKAKVEDFYNYQSLIMLTAQNYVYYGDNGELVVQSLREIPDYTITKDVILTEFAKLFTDQNKRILNAIIYISPVFVFVVIMLAQLFTWLTQAFYVWLVSKVIAAKVDFSSSFRYIITVTVFIDTLVTVAIQIIIVFFKNLQNLTNYISVINSLYAFIIFAMPYYFLKEYKKYKNG